MSKYPFCKNFICSFFHSWDIHLESITKSSMCSFGCGSTTINLKSSNEFSIKSTSFLPFSLKSMIRWIFGSPPLFILDLFIMCLYCFTLRFIFSSFIIWKLPQKTLSDHEYFCIHDDLFDRIKSTDQDQNFLWKFSYNEIITEDESRSEAIETHNEKIQNKKRRATKYSTKHTLQRKRQKPVD